MCHKIDFWHFLGRMLWIFVAIFVVELAELYLLDKIGNLLNIDIF